VVRYTFFSNATLGILQNVDLFYDCLPRVCAATEREKNAKEKHFGQAQFLTSAQRSLQKNERDTRCYVGVVSHGCYQESVIVVGIIKK